MACLMTRPNHDFSCAGEWKRPELESIDLTAQEHHLNAQLQVLIQLPRGLPRSPGPSGSTSFEDFLGYQPEATPQTQKGPRATKPWKIGFSEKICPITSTLLSPPPHS